MIELMTISSMLCFTYKMITMSPLEDQKEMFLIVLLVLLCSTILITISAFSWRSHGQQKAFRLPQGDMGWPVLGETLPFLKPHPSTSIGDFMQQRISKHGKIFMSNLLGKPTVVSADAELNRFILQADSRLFEPGWSRSIGEVLGKHSILLQVGDAHKKMRSINLNFANNGKLKTPFLRDAYRIAAFVMSSWKNDSVVLGKYEARKLCFHMMAKNILSLEPGTPVTEKLRKEYEAFAKGVVSLPLNLPGTAYSKALKARSYILEVVWQCMEERLCRKKDVEEEDAKDDLLQWTLENSNYSEEQIGDLILGTFFGGYNTTSKAIALAIYFLGGCPKAVEQFEEHDRIVQGKRRGGNSELSCDDYKQMEFTQCVINETLRLGNIVPYIQRKASTHIKFKGYDIPQGCNVMAVLPAVHLDPSFFESPEQFNPWRWQSDHGIRRTNNFMAFGGGARLCPGAVLGRMEMAVFLHHLVINFNWELAEPDLPMAFPSLDFPKGLPIKVRLLSNPQVSM
ncbi:cytochrome P450 90B1-like [Phoenix dactylifera]|uniref:Cytochrome P450 90B1-like n=1 Tax=Phoenix dactylifera TaxID=42345 RepID=A0A8B9A5Q4_PHODC|nr:cytochrome P450 90B1-like [Phoenix dactylifera]